MRVVSSQGPALPTSKTATASPIWQIPVTLWGYGLLRSLAFAAPSWSRDGRIGLGLFVVIVLYGFVLRRSRRAWKVLVALDAFSLVLLAVAWIDADDAPIAIPMLAAGALLVLLAPSTRRHVSAFRPSSVPQPVAAARS